MNRAIYLHELELNVVHRDCAWMDVDELRRSGERVRRWVIGDLERLLSEVLDPYEGEAAPPDIEVELHLGSNEVGAAPKYVPRFVRTAAGKIALGSPIEADRAQASPGAGVGAGWVANNLPPAATDTSTRNSGEGLFAPSSMLDMLVAWSVDGALRSRLAFLPAPALIGLCESICAALDLPRAASQQKRGGAAVTLARPSTRKLSLADCLSDLVELAASDSETREATERLSAALHFVRGVNPAESSLTAANLNEGQLSADVALPLLRSEAQNERPAQADDEHPPSVPAVAAILADTSVENALPLLMLGSLHRTGWIETVATLLREAGAPDLASTLGFALAMKALPLPDRGWRHDPRQLHAAATAAGIAEPLSGERLAFLGRAIGRYSAAADSILSDSLLRGRSVGSPLAVVAADGCIVLMDPQGLFPIAIGKCWSDIEAAARLAETELLVGPQSSSSGLLSEISQGGLTFAASGSVSRGEPWSRAVGANGWSGMTNSSRPLHSAMLHATASWACRERDALEVVNGFGPARPVPGLELESPLGRSLTFAATVALGDIAWRLSLSNPGGWSEPDASLAFERFFDLSARVRVDAETVKTIIPLGPRGRDLLGAGFCSDVPGIPWMEGRVLRFAMG